MNQIFELPSGESTSDAEHAVRSWTEFTRPLKELFGLELYGMFPDFSFTINRPDTYRLTSLALPKWFVKELCKILSTMDLTNEEK